MSKTSLGLSKRIAAGLLASGLALFGTALAPSAGADTVDTVTDACGRLAGQTRFGTAGAIADAYEAEVGGVDTAIIANGRNFPDALAASGLARDLNAPILLIEPPTSTDSVPLETQSALDELGVSNIVIVGGTAAVSQNVEDDLDERYGTVTREAGDLREDTAAEIARAIGTAGSHDGMVTAIIATGDNYPDALAGGPISYHGDGTNPFPILLTRGGDVPASTEAALEELGVEQVIVLGGTAAVPASAVAELATITGNDPIVLAGNLREDTAKAVADFAVDELGFDLTTALLADGREHFPSPDALSGGPLGGVTNSPILLVTPDTMPPATEDFLTERADQLEQVIALGGTSAVSPEVLDAGCEAAGVPLEGPPADETNQSFEATPAEAAENTVSDADAPNRGARTYTFSGLTAGTTYDVVLFDCADVTNTNGTVSFADADGANNAGDNEADWNTADTAAVIEVVNGTAIAPDDSIEVAPVNGTITFSIDSTNPNECVVPVVFNDATENDEMIELDANNQPTEEFAIGGAKTFRPEEPATAANIGAAGADEEIVDVDKEADRIVTDEALYFYDANDTFFVVAGTAGAGDDDTAACDAPANQVTLAGFEAQLSAGDELDGSTFYQPNEELSSSFCLEDLDPTAPAISGASNTTDTSTTLTLTGVDPAATEVTVYCEADADQADDAVADAVTVTTADPECATATQDASATVAGFQVVVSGLQPNTAYDFAATQTVDGEESAVSNEQENVTTAAGPVERPLINDAQLTTDAVVEGRVSDGDVWTLVFNEPMDPTSVLNTTIDLTDADGDTFQVRCVNNTGADVAPGAGDFITDAACLLGDGANATVANDTLVVTLLEDAVDRNAAGNAGTAGGGIDYPATIQAIATLTDLDDDALVDVANSPDRVIDDEPDA